MRVIHMCLSLGRLIDGVQLDMYRRHVLWGVHSKHTKQQANYKQELLAKQAADDARYARVKRERAYLLAQRKEAAHQVCVLMYYYYLNKYVYMGV